MKENLNSVSIELKKLYEDDQAIRNNSQFFKELTKNLEADRMRRQKVIELLSNSDLLTAKDYYYAAMIFQHGDSTADFWKAHELAKKSFSLGEVAANWLTSATYDRWLMSQGKPQKFCTQYVNNEKTGEYELYNYDASVTDEERVNAGSRTLNEALELGKKFSIQFK